MIDQIRVSEKDRGRRLDHWLANLPGGLSRSRIQKLIAAGQVAVNDQPCFENSYRLQAGDRISMAVPAPEETAVKPEAIPLDIVYEDGDLLVINKPRGMVVHPAPGHSGGTLVNALLGCCRDLSGIGGVIRPGIVHRLDKDTSGLLLVAKNDAAHKSLSGQLKKRQLRREYIALVYGWITPSRGRIEAPVGRHPVQRKKMAVVTGGREAVTRYRLIKYLGPYSLLRLILETGRTHQIRVHLAYIGYPVVGDPAYAGSAPKGPLPPELAAPQALHARLISFSHPRSGEQMQFSAPLPPIFLESLRWLRHHQTGP